MANKLQVYQIEDTRTGKVYNIEGPASASDEELFSFLEQDLASGQPATVTPTPNTAPPQAPVEAPAPAGPSGAQAPEEAPRQEVQTSIINTTEDFGDPRFLGPSGEQEYTTLASDPNVPWEQVNNFVRQQATAQGLPAPDVMVTPADLQRFRQELAEKPDADVGAVTYRDWKTALPQAEATVTAPENDPILRAYQDAIQYSTPGWLARTYHDWVGTGMEQLRQKFPDATPDQLEELQENVINYVQRGVRAANIEATEDDPLIPWLAGQVIGSAGVEDFVPFIGGAGVAGRVGQAAGINTAADVGYQAADVAAGVQDEFNPEQAALAPVVGTAFHGAIEGVGALARTRGPKSGASAPAATVPGISEGIFVPSGRKNSKVYKEGIAQSATQMADHINRITDGWSNAPVMEVHKNFRDMDGIDNDGLGVTTADGKVLLNAENILAEANARKVDPEDIVSAVTYHEALGHHGLSQKFGDELQNVLAAFYDNSTTSFRNKVDKWLDDNPEAYQGAQDRHLLAAEEVLAEMSEAGRLPVTFVNRLANVVKEFARQMGLDLKFSEREIRTIMGIVHDGVVVGPRRKMSVGGNRYMTGIPNRQLVEKYMREEGMGEMQAVNRARAEAFKNSSRSGINRRDTTELDRYIEQRVAERRQRRDGGRRQNDPISKEQERALLEYANARNLRPSQVLDELERGVNPEAQAEIDARVKQLRPEVDLEAARQQRERLEERSPVGYNNRKAIDLIQRAEANPGQVQTEKMWPNSPDIVDFRYVDPETRSEVYGSFREVGDTAEAFEIYGEGANTVGPKVLQTIRRQLRQQFPEIKKIEAMRLSGARNKGVEVPYKDATPVEVKLSRYMKRRTKEEITDEESIANAHEILSQVLDNYEPTYRGWDEAKRAARQKGLTAKQIRKSNRKGWEDLDKRLFQYDAVADTTDQTLTRLHEKMNNGTFTMKDKARYLETIYSYNELLGRIFDDQAEVGRALNAMKALSFTKRKISDLNEILREYQGNNISAFADEETFNKFAKRIQQMIESGNDRGVHNALVQVVKPYWWQFGLSFRHAMMLSGLGTHAKNAADNSMILARELEEQVLALPAGVVRKGLRAAGADVQEGVSPQEVGARVYGLLRAMFDGSTYKETLKAFREGHGATPYSSKIEMQDARIPIVSKVQDALHASDTFFRAFHMNANLYTLGVRKARQEGFTGVAAFEEGTNLAANPTYSMIQEAKNLTDIALLVDTPSTPSARLEALKAIKPGMKAGEQATSFIANLLFPFFRVTDRLIFQKLRRSPLAFVDHVTRQDLAAGGARMDIAIARMVYGSAIIYYYWQKAGEGEIEGRAPGDYEKRQALEAGGYLPNSVLKDGKYVDASALNLSPLPWQTQNAVAANIASIRKAYDTSKADSDSTAQALGYATLSLLKELASTSFAENLTPYTEAISAEDYEEDAALANVAGGLASQFVPAAVRQYNQMYADTVRRDTTGDKSIPDRIYGRVASAIPGLSDDLPAKYDVYGDVMQQGRTLSSISNYQEIKDDEVSVELQRLERTTEEPVVRGAPSSFQHEGERIKLTAAGKQEWQRVQGYYLRLGMSQTIPTDEWKSASDEEKIQIVKEVRTEAYELTKEYMLPLLGVTSQEEEE